MAKKLFLYLDPHHRRNRKSFQMTNEKVIEGTFLLHMRKVIKLNEYSAHCEECYEQLSYNEEYDSNYCAHCNEWAEETCEEMDCEFCSRRPLRPL